MVLKILKIKECGRILRYGVLCLLCLLCTDLEAVEVMETGHGKVLIESQPLETGGEKLTDAESRDPFNWSHEFIDQNLARMQSKQDLFIDLQLTGIVWNPQAPQAIINKMLLKEGEMVENVMVLKISKDSVLLASGGARHTLYFKQRIIDLGTASDRKAKGSNVRK